MIAAPTGRENPAPRGEPDWFRKQRGYTAHDAKCELFNVRSDPAQQANLAATEPGRVEAMLAILEKYRSAGRSVPARQDPIGRP